MDEVQQCRTAARYRRPRCRNETAAIARLGAAGLSLWTIGRRARARDGRPPRSRIRRRAGLSTRARVDRSKAGRLGYPARGANYLAIPIWCTSVHLNEVRQARYCDWPERTFEGVAVKYFVSATPGPMPPTPEQFDAAVNWLEGKLNDGRFDCIFGFIEGAASASSTRIRTARCST